MSLLTKADMHRLLRLLDTELEKTGVDGELYLVGGAVMCLAFDARPSTHDLDGYFKPAQAIRTAAADVAAATGMPESWLNDSVKGFLSPRGEFDAFLALPHLRVFVANPRYLFAMKCAAMRLGEEFHDLDDVRYLLRYLNIETVDEALAIVTQYFNTKQLLPKTQLVLEELLGQ